MSGMVEEQEDGRVTGSRADASSQQAVSTEGFDPARLSSLAFVLPYDDGGERISVTHDSRSQFWSGQVVIRQYESDDRILYVDLADIDWLIGALKLVALAAGTRNAETRSKAQSEGCQSGDAEQRNAQPTSGGSGD